MDSTTRLGFDHYGDLRYTSAGEFASYRDEDYEKKHPPDGSHPPGYGEHRMQFSPDGTYGKWIVSHDTVIKINDRLFLHGGISAKYASTKIREINEKVRQELKGNPDGPPWYRGVHRRRFARAAGGQDSQEFPRGTDSPRPHVCGRRDHAALPDGHDWRRIAIKAHLRGDTTRWFPDAVRVYRS